MTVFKCKMCGGTLEINANETTATCEYCGTMQTLPKLDDDRKSNLYDRADHFRRNNDYDKAMGIYEQILNEDNTDAEAYWSIVLCRYGIEYVEDPSSHKRVPTVNRAQYTSIYADEDYKSAIEHADISQKIIYESEAKAIDEIQKGILAISQNEKPYDVFICYKETDSNGRRTQDSVLANDLYHQLTQEGFKVFFSRITLEDKLGTAYEPYIFAALNSAKAMVVLGTKPEFFSAVWVKNEWSRYLSLIKNGAKKVLIPAYRDMDPYDLPEEFSHLQAQDMSKLGFMQDLIRGIKKILAVDEPKPLVTETVVVQQTAAPASNTAPLLKRAFMFLEDGDWNSANEYAEKVLDIDPECAEAYLAKLMAEVECRKLDSLKDCSEPFDNSGNYAKAYKFGADELKEKLEADNMFIRERNEKTRKTKIYNEAVAKMESASSESVFKRVADKFKSIHGFKDSDNLAKECLEKAEIERKEAVYNNAIKLSNSQYIINIENAIKHFQSISEYKDSNEKIVLCKSLIDKIYSDKNKVIEDAERQRKEKINNAKAAISRTVLISVGFLIIVIIVATLLNSLFNPLEVAFTIIIPVLIIFYVVVETIISNQIKYHRAIIKMYNGKYDKAIEIFGELGEYKDSRKMITETIYIKANSLYEKEQYKEAIDLLTTIKTYGDSENKIEEIRCKLKEIRYKKNVKIVNTNVDVGAVILWGVYANLQGQIDKDIEWIVIAKEDNKALVISRDILYLGKYDESNNYSGDSKNITWEKCTQRKKLNNNFFNLAFSAYEQERIMTTDIIVDENDACGINRGEDTRDKIFLLSVQEADKYFSNNSDRIAKYCGGTFSWLLRSTAPGNVMYMYENTVAEIGSDGEVHFSGISFNVEKGIRPAMWISLD